MADSGTCENCPTGAECAEGATLSTLVIAKEYYRFRLDSDTLYKCPSGKAAACPGSMALNGTESAGQALCGEWYEGVLCTKCRYFYTNNSNLTKFLTLELSG